MLGAKATEIAIGQIQGYIKPTKAERQAAYELFIELSSRTATVTAADERRSIRDVLANLAKMPDITRAVLRSHGTDSAKDRKDGNIALAAIALRVVNEVILPRLAKWDPLLRNHEDHRAADGDGIAASEWELDWDVRTLCEADLESMRGEIRAYLDTLARIAGTPDLADLVVPNPPGAPIPPTTFTTDPDMEDAKPKWHMVGWFNPLEHLHTVIAHRGKNPAKNDNQGRRRVSPREAPRSIDILPEQEDGDLWVDYVSDLGDGIDPTLAVAWQLTRPALTLPVDRSGELPQPPPSLPRGTLLVMGGDEVYPHASAEGYKQQTVLPYRLAADAQLGGGTPPTPDRNTLVAIPGNHDWYGGPEHFEKVFTHNGGDTFADHWSTPQHERWWAVRLPHGWWMWGLDTALDNTLDEHQIDYFEQMSTELEEGDRVIICSPVPMWQLRQKREDEYFRIRAVLSRLILERGARTPLFLSGDSHFFAQYRRVDGAADEHHVTAGGGGAFLQPTHNLPEHVPYERGSTEFKLGQRWPRPVDSRRLGAGIGAISLRQFWLLILLLGGLHAAFAGLVAHRVGALGDAQPEDGFEDAARWVIGGWMGWPLIALVMVAMIKAGTPNSGESSLTTGAKRYGAMHGATQVASLVGIAAISVWMWSVWWSRFVVIPLIGGVVSVGVFVMFVKWINRSIRASDTLAFSPAHSTRYKHFLRMHFEPTGDLTVYAIGVDPVGDGWFEALTGSRRGARWAWLRRRVARLRSLLRPRSEPERLIPPFDQKAGVPRLHYVWGRKFPTASEQLVQERERSLGKDHPDTIVSRSGWARKLLNDQQVDELDIFWNNVQSCQRTHGFAHPITLAATDLLCDALVVADEFEAAAFLSQHTLQQRESTGGEPSAERAFELAQAQIRLAEIYMRFPDHNHNAQRTIKLLHELVNGPAPSPWALHLTARAYDCRGDRQAAIRTMKTAVSTFEAVLGPIHRASVRAEFELCELEWFDTDDPTREREISERLRTALETCREHFGEADDLTVKVRLILARAVDADDERIRLTQENLQALIEDHAGAAEINWARQELADASRDAYRVAGNLQLRIQQAEEAVAESRNHSGTDHWRTYYNRILLADARLETGNPRRAASELKQLLDECERTGEPGSPFEDRDTFIVTMAKQSLVPACIEVGEFDVAEALLDELDLLADDPVGVSSARIDLASARLAHGEAEQAQALFDRVAHADDPNIVEKLSDVLIHAGGEDDRLLQLWSRQYDRLQGGNDEGAAFHAAVQYAWSLYSSQQLEPAREILETTLEPSNPSHDDDDLYYGSINLGHIMARVDDGRSAIKLLDDMLEHHLGTDGWQTTSLWCLHGRAAAFARQGRYRDVVELCSGIVSIDPDDDDEFWNRVRELSVATTSGGDQTTEIEAYVGLCAAADHLERSHFPGELIDREVLARLLETEDLITRALEVQEELLRFNIEGFGDESPQVVKTRLNIARLSTKPETLDLPRAIAMYKQIIAAWGDEDDTLTDEEYEGQLNIRSKLVRAYFENGQVRKALVKCKKLAKWAAEDLPRHHELRIEIDELLEEIRAAASTPSH